MSARAHRPASLAKRCRLFGLLVVVCALTGVAAGEESVPAGGKLTFGRNVLPILEKHCLKCHGEGAQKADLDLRSVQGALKGGESGEPAIVPGQADKSHLVELIATHEMPPKGNAALSLAEIDVVRKWIEAGAPADELSGSPGTQQQLRRLAREVQFVFEIKCQTCHGQKTQKAGLSLASVAAMVRGGQSGGALVKGNPAGSLIVHKIADDLMPPRDLRYKLSIKPVSPSELELIEKWIAAGAPEPPAPEVAADDGGAVTAADRQWWSFRAPLRPELPAVRDQSRVRTPIDAFLLRALESHGLGYSPEADRETLVRRLFIDLVGLPPTPAEVDEFVQDQGPLAYERLVDRLLASPAYGERWAQHWLDAAGYSDSEGSAGADPIHPNAYRYRDYVVRSLNADKPYDRFLLEQLAGDELVSREQLAAMSPETADALVATGFLRTGIDPTTSPELNFLYDRYQVLADEVEIVSSSLLGLTMRCARCHSHKYDPLPQRDYYRFTAIFAGAYAPQDWLKPKDRDVPLATPAEKAKVQAANAPTEAKIAGLRREAEALTDSARERLQELQLAQLPSAIRGDVRTALRTPADKRTAVERYLVVKFERELTFEQAQLVAALPEFKRRSEALNAEIRAVEATLQTLPAAQALCDVGAEAPPFYLLRRGEWNHRGPLVTPGVPAVLTDGKSNLTVEPTADGRSTGRRLALARWLTRPDHPLTARVFVNRVWQQHFGAGIVPTPDDFGHTGARPSNPALLDWLATEFVSQGWSVKHLHRLIVNSTAYRQQSRVRGEATSVDPENRLLWRMPLRRMDAETLRDSILAVSGALDRGMFGSPAGVELNPDGQVVTTRSPNPERRSIYLLRRRSTPLTMLEVFDSPRLTTNCVQRRTSIVVSQALLLLNSQFMDAEAARFAQRVAQEAGPQSARRLEYAYRLALGREPEPQEQELGLKFLTEESARYAKLAAAKDKPTAAAPPEEQALADLCLVLFNSAKFLYVD